jgi:hypothetical protein
MSSPALGPMIQAPRILSVSLSLMNFTCVREGGGGAAGVCVWEGGGVYECVLGGGGMSGKHTLWDELSCIGTHDPGA